MGTTINQSKSAELTLEELAARSPVASRVFRLVGLDYWSEGKKTLSEACAEKSLDPEVVLRSIGEAETPRDPSWKQKPLDALIQHIIERYHEPLRRELPELVDMASTVEAKHVEKPTCPHGLTDLLTTIHEAILSHLEKEEQILFPMILAGRGAQAAGPIQVMEMEHEDHRANLARIRALTADLTAPPEACPTWQALYLRLRELESDLADHIYLEDRILFPRALYES